jgi:uncharacterized cupin superfamily protein
MRPLNLSSLDFEYVQDDPEGFRSGGARLGFRVGARRTGITVYELPPGQAVCPYHYEYGEEEWLVVVSGRVSVRTPDGVVEAGEGDVCFFPPGPSGAHGVRNDTRETARVLMFSDVVFPTGTAYPDSDKVALYTGDFGEDIIVERSSAVDYFEGEDGS